MRSTASSACSRPWEPPQILHPRALVEELRDTVLGFAGTLQDDLDILALRRQAQGA